MRAKHHSIAALLSLAALITLLIQPFTVSAQTDALTGTVSSTEEGVMEGVLVSAKKEGSNKTITVVSDEKGRYRFPAGRLEAGKQLISIRAAGYDLSATPVPEVTAKGGATADLKLVKTKDLAAQLSNAKWLHSATGTYQQKRPLLNCVAATRWSVFSAPSTMPRALCRSFSAWAPTPTRARC